MVYKISGITRRIIREPTSSRTIRKLPLANRSGLGVLDNPSQESTFGGCIFLDEDEDFPYLMMFYPITSSKKASMDSKHPSNISWPYKFRLFFRPLHLHCKVEFSKMHAICWPAIIELRRSHNMFLYSHALLPYFSQCG